MIKTKTHVRWLPWLLVDDRGIAFLRQRRAPSYCGVVFPPDRFVDNVDLATCGTCKRLVAKDIAHDIEDALG